MLKHATLSLSKNGLWVCKVAKTFEQKHSTNTTALHIYLKYNMIALACHSTSSIAYIVIMATSKEAVETTKNDAMLRWKTFFFAFCIFIICVLAFQQFL